MRIDEIENSTEEEQIAAVSNWFGFIDEIKNPSDAVQIAAIQNNKSAFWLYLKDKNPSEAVQIAAVTPNPDQYHNYGEGVINMIANIKNPSEPVQLAAVKSHLLSIKYIKNPTELVKSTHASLVVNYTWPVGANNQDILNKKPVLTKLLKLIKKAAQGDQFSHILYLIKGLRMKGYNWPELDIIEKSARKELKK